MAALVTLPNIIAAVGAAAAVASSMQQASTAKKVASYNATMAEQNAQISRQQAAENAEIQGRDSRKRIALAKVNYGASGIAMEGTPLDVLEESVAMAELDRQNILYGGELQASGLSGAATLARYSGDAAKSAGYSKAGSELLSFGSNVYRKPPSTNNPPAASASQTLSQGSGYSTWKQV